MLGPWGGLLLNTVNALINLPLCVTYTVMYIVYTFVPLGCSYIALHRWNNDAEWVTGSLWVGSTVQFRAYCTNVEFVLSSGKPTDHENLNKYFFFISESK